MHQNFLVTYIIELMYYLRLDIDIQLKPLIPVNFDSWEISTTLHGGLGNNLFQMGETISFCKKYNLPDPFFGTWDLWNGGR